MLRDILFKKAGLGVVVLANIGEDDEGVSEALGNIRAAVWKCVTQWPSVPSPLYL